MSIQLKRKPGESISAFLRRFSRAIQLSGVLLESKRRRFRRPSPNKNARRMAALRRETVKKEIERLKKLGIEK